MSQAVEGLQDERVSINTTYSSPSAVRLNVLSMAERYVRKAKHEWVGL